MGYITNINLVAAIYFGYNKTELISLNISNFHIILDRKINELIPGLISKYHDTLMVDF